MEIFCVNLSRMKLTISVLFVVVLAMAVVSVPANHHKKHRGNNVKLEEYLTTFNPIDGDGGNGEDFEWPEPERIRNFDLPKAFGLGISNNSRSESVPAKQHDRSRHGSHSH